MAVYDRSLMDTDRSLHIGLTDDLRLAYTNDVWETFACANDGSSMLEKWPLGTPWAECLPSVLHAFYLEGFATARTTGVAFENSYECPSPTTARLFRMRTEPLRRGFLSVHSLRSESPTPTDPAKSHRYAGAEGTVVQCANCRRVRRTDGSEQWDWVRAFVEHRDGNISHGLCATCFEVYHPDPARAAQG